MTDAPLIEHRMMGKAGHALEVLVGDLFEYSGFQVERNKETRVGEIDVLASSGQFTVVIECKEYHPDSAAVVVRDMISNVAKKTELLGFKNAVLVTTKPPSSQLLSFASEAGVVVRSLDDLGRIRKQWGEVQPSEKIALLVKGFNLTSDTEGAASKRRKLWLEELIRNPSKNLVKRTTFNIVHRIRWYLLGLALGILIVLGLAAYLVPGFAQTLGAIALLIVLTPFGWLYWKNENRKPQRKKRKSR